MSSRNEMGSYFEWVSMAAGSHVGTKICRFGFPELKLKLIYSETKKRLTIKIEKTGRLSSFKVK